MKRICKRHEEGITQMQDKMEKDMESLKEQHQTNMKALQE